MIGRALDAAVVLEEPSISRNHVRLTRLPAGGYAVEDLGSTNGTWINGVPVKRGTLAFGDRLQVGFRVVLLLTRFDPIEENLQRRQRFEILGRMGAGIAHDLNNIIAGMLAASDFLVNVEGSQSLSNPEVRECVDDIRTAAADARELTGAILAFVRSDSDASDSADVSQVCTDLARLVRHTFDRAIRVETKVAPRLFVRAMSGELFQMLMNLCVNAGDAMPSGGTLTLQTHVLAPSELPRDVPLRDRPHVVIQVSDTGRGIEPEALRHIFEPFFTTKNRQTNQGLGLGAVSEVATRLGGIVTVDSVVGRGTTFRIYLPKLPRRNGTTSRARVAAPAPIPSNSRVLLVDDDPMVQRSVARLLRQSGYDVVVASDGLEALSKYVRNPKPRVVLLDLDMPGMDGETTCAKLLKLDPHARVLFVTGHDLQSYAPQLRALGAFDTLAKPYSGQSLIAAIESALTALPSLRPDDDEDEKTIPGHEG